MRNRNIVLGVIAAMLLLIVAALAWWLGSPLFINRAVEESFDFPDATQVAAMPEATQQVVATAVMATAAAMPPISMTETMPPQPVALLAGMFQGADDFHRGSGTATLYQLPDGNLLLRLDPFEVINGPDLHVILSANPAPTTSDQVMESYLDLGSLKGNLGSQNYDLPPGTNIVNLRSVVIYCVPFHVIFATAPLAAITE